MSTQIDIFKQQLPSHVVNAKSRTMQAMSGGLSGGFGNRISLKNSKFRFIQSGSDLGPIPDPTLEVVVFAMATNVQRMYYAGAYQPNSKDKPTCFSQDGKVPSDESQHKQSATCNLCPQNIKGSGRMPGTKACAYKKRVVILSPDDLSGPMYALDVAGMSMFGEQDPTQNLYSFKGFYEKLVAHNMDIAAIVTRLSFDDSASVPKLHFSPVRALTSEEFAVVLARQEDDEVGRILSDMTNDMETEVDNGTKAPTPQLTQQPAPPVQAKQGVGGLIQDVAPSVASAAARKGGFPTRQANVSATAAPAVQQQATESPKQPTKPIEVDLDALTSFDDA